MSILIATSDEPLFNILFRKLTPELLMEMGIQQLPEYKDPYSKRVMTYGEIGCFLSHYNVWQNVSKRKCQHVGWLLSFHIFLKFRC
jgi:GR25 family glycosyltransferase involved in LPS biosynthesis